MEKFPNQKFLAMKVLNLAMRATDCFWNFLTFLKVARTGEIFEIKFLII